MRGKEREASDFCGQAFFTATEVSIKDLTTAVHRLLVGVESVQSLRNSIGQRRNLQRSQMLCSFSRAAVGSPPPLYRSHLSALQDQWEVAGDAA